MSGEPKTDVRALRRRLYVQLEPAAWPHAGLSPLNAAVMALICAAVVVAVLGTEPVLHRGNEGLFLALELAITAAFALEYAARVWTALERPDVSGWRAVLNHVRSPSAIVDLLAVLLPLLALAGSESFILRLAQLLRILRLTRLGRFSTALALLADALRARRYELTASLVLALSLLLASSALLYLAERTAQPDDFGSIPRAMWWSIATLTTVGYGDAYPVTAAGKVLAGLTALTGIGLIAMPAGILAAAFSEALQGRRRMKEEATVERDL